MGIFQEVPLYVKFFKRYLDGINKIVKTNENTILDSVTRPRAVPRECCIFSPPPFLFHV